MAILDFDKMMRLSARMPDPAAPISGVKYVAEFTDDKKTTIALTWFTHNKDNWKAILEAIRKLPERSYNAASKKWEVPYNSITENWLKESGWTTIKEKNPEEKRVDPRIKQQEKIDATKLDPEGTLIPGLRPYQIDFLKFAQLRHGRLALGDEMGCVCGDTTVEVCQDGKIYRSSIESLYRLFHSSSEDVDWSIQCWKGRDSIGFSEIVDVVNSGNKRCIRLTMDSGIYLVCTNDHKVLTDEGWIEAEKTLNMYVYCEREGKRDIDRVIAISNAGLRATYDIKVLNDSNFTANHIIVHNCGKTVEALAWMVYANAYPALYVVNAPTKLQWQGAYRKWVGATKKHYPDVDVLSGKTPYHLSHDKSYIINWDILSDWQYELAKVGFRLLVGDEVQAIGNQKSQRAQAFVYLSKTIPHVIGMSGTPAMSKPLQFYTLLNIVEPRVFRNYYSFANRYCDPQTDGYGTKYNGASHVEELHELLVGCMLRRTKSEVMKDLPSKVMEVVPLEVDESALEAYYEDERDTFSDKEPSGDEKKESARNKVAHLLRSAYALKEKSMIKWIEDFLDSGEKLLLFAWHRSVVEILFDTFKDYYPVCIYGGMSPNDREKARTTFIEDNKCRLVVANILAGGVGIDGWQDVCSNVAFAEFAHTPNLHRQAEDRLHRSGQRNSVTSYYLIAPNTIDTEAIEVLDSRAKMLDGVLDGKETATSDLLTELLERRGVKMTN